VLGTEEARARVPSAAGKDSVLLVVADAATILYTAEPPELPVRVIDVGIVPPVH
jgi:hypothetical protein